jgi:hypothetical protein
MPTTRTRAARTTRIAVVIAALVIVAAAAATTRYPGTDRVRMQRAVARQESGVQWWHVKVSPLADRDRRTCRF